MLRPDQSSPGGPLGAAATYVAAAEWIRLFFFAFGEKKRGIRRRGGPRTQAVWSQCDINFVQ